MSKATLQQKLDDLRSYTQPGSTFRIIAMEEISLLQIELGNLSEAINTLEALLQEPEINRGQSKRASDLLRTLRDPKGVDISE